MLSCFGQQKTDERFPIGSNAYLLFCLACCMRKLQYGLFVVVSVCKGQQSLIFKSRLMDVIRQQYIRLFRIHRSFVHQIQNIQHLQVCLVLFVDRCLGRANQNTELVSMRVQSAALFVATHRSFGS